MKKLVDTKTESLKMKSFKKGSWSPEEDETLSNYIRRYGIWNWTLMPKAAGLSRSGKSCRLRWMNYLRPSLKKECYSKEEIQTIIKLHKSLGNKWLKIAEMLPGRTDNGIKNFWHTHIKKSLYKCKAISLEDGENNYGTRPKRAKHSKQKRANSSTCESTLPGFEAPLSSSSLEESFPCSDGIDYRGDLILDPFVVEVVNSRKMDNSSSDFEEHVDWGFPEYSCDSFSDDQNMFWLNNVFVEPGEVEYELW